MELAEEAVILSTKSGVYYGLDEVGARIWHLLKEPMTVQNLLDAILQEFDATADQCEPDRAVHVSAAVGGRATVSGITEVYAYGAGAA